MEETAKNVVTDEKLEQKLKASLVDGYLPCSVAFQISRELKVNRNRVGDMATRLKVQIVNCQLGFFQLEKATHDDLDVADISQTLIDEIEASLVNGRLTCPVAFKIAKKMKVTPREVGDAATKQNIKIMNCQLGCFP